MVLTNSIRNSMDVQLRLRIMGKCIRTVRRCLKSIDIFPLRIYIFAGEICLYFLNSVLRYVYDFFFVKRDVGCLKRTLHFIRLPTFIIT